ncbi:MAG: DUF4249 domain-containing protein [Reichenbachiella sp.]|uniref:DUF4249 domain-containing protein n=1 Tax=Reichenbachiella sp. TaxID=2184521 RepID=UPI0032656C78
MQNIIYTFLIVCLLSSCLEVIDLKHDDNAPVLIVDGLITDQPGPHFVKLSTTISFNSSERSFAVEDATVTLSNDLGEEEQLLHIGSGTYQITTIQGVVGRTYDLNIDYDGQTYTSQSTMLPVSEIAEMASTFRNATSLSDAGYYVSMAALVSVPDKINYYRWKVYKSDSLFSGKEDIIVAEDEYADGSFEFEFEYPFELNDEVKVEMSSLNKDAYEYYNGLAEVLSSDGGLFSPPPVNAPSNISNGALGLFQANAVSSDVITITE